MKHKSLLLIPIALLLSSCFSYSNSNNYNNGNGNNNNNNVSQEKVTDGILSFNGSSVTALDTSISGDIIIPDVYNSQTITTIPSGAFKNCTKIKSIYIPKTVTSIAQGAFAGCIQLESITVPFVGLSPDKTSGGGHLGQIFGTDSYNGGTAVKSYYNGSSYNAYYLPSSLRSVTVTDATTLVYGAFQNAKMLTEINLNDDIIAVGDYCFSGVNQIKTVSLPNIYTIPYGCFEGCTKLESFNIGNKVTKIDYKAFKDCMNLTRVGSDVDGKFVVPDSVTEISDNAFYNCLKIEDITLPIIGNSDSKTGGGGHFGRIFGDSSYTGATSAKCYYSSSSYNAYYVPAGLRSVTITSATHVVMGAFQNMSMLTSLRINQAASSSVGDRAFENCVQPIWY